MNKEIITWECNESALMSSHHISSNLNGSTVRYSIESLNKKRKYDKKKSIVKHILVSDMGNMNKNICFTIDEKW